MSLNLNEVMRTLPADWEVPLMEDIRRSFLASDKTLVVLDDDPTGTQTCYDVVVLTCWTTDRLSAELAKKPSILFILTNSRSMPEAAARSLAVEIGKNLLEASANTGRDIAIISRSDSTLRGHFPAEVDAVARALELEDAIRILVPAFIEGGRITIGDVHYVREGDNLVPVSETPFARDAVFGYVNADLRKWVEEKTKGNVAATKVLSVSLDDIRKGGPGAVLKKLMTSAPGAVVVVNACSHRDLEVLVMGLLLAEAEGRRFLYRTSATFVPIRAGIPAGKIYNPSHQGVASTGSLVVVGSYVPKTTRQLEHLLAQGQHHAIEVDIPAVLQATSDVYAQHITKEADAQLRAGEDVVIYTSRTLETGTGEAETFRIQRAVSAFLVDIVKGLSARPAFIVAKGGITSSDVATQGLGAEKATVLGQVIPGVPIWQMDDRSKYPGLLYTVFPGNVGGDNALNDVCRRLAPPAGTL